jgi:16S rRNA A1518/A1519 N6-dimethyltransferase RsmA/KsgA/DIM1 with predicted DNA glycosylase/AP lyase activity
MHGRGLMEEVAKMEGKPKEVVIEIGLGVGRFASETLRK